MGLCSECDHGDAKLRSADKFQPLLQILVIPLFIYTLHFLRVRLSQIITSTAFATTMAHNSVEKKDISVHESDGIPINNDAVIASHSDNDSRFDQALDFLKQHKNEAAVSLSRQASFTRALRRRVDFRVIPFLCCCYTLNFLDKVLLNVRHFGGGRKNDSFFKPFTNHA